MENTFPRFVRRTTVVGSSVMNSITFVTLDVKGNKVEMTMWELVNKYGASAVLEMRAKYPEFEDKK